MELLRAPSFQNLSKDLKRVSRRYDVSQSTNTIGRGVWGGEIT